jgi:two-component system, LuxR family, response regulator FixJ
MNQPPNPELFLVEDDRDIRDLLSIVLAHAGYSLTCFGEAESFLAETRRRSPDCVLLDIQMPGASGLDALTKLTARHFDAPVIIMSAHCKTRMVVEAIKRGAFDFIEKPFEPATVVERVRDALERSMQHKASQHVRQPLGFRGANLLTAREREVLERISAGDTSKEAACRLGISPRTVQIHRSRIMEKLKAKNTAELMRIVLNSEASSVGRAEPDDVAFRDLERKSLSRESFSP